MSEEKAQQLMQQMQMIESYFSDLSQREDTLFSVLGEATSAIESMKSLKQKSTSDTLVPIGMGTYVKTKISSADKIILNIGSGVALEKDTDAAVNYLEARIKEIEVALKETATKKQDAATRLEQGKAQLNQLMMDVSQQPSG